ncbi:MAG: putative aminopeptidase YhfE [Chloroflexota bacterium]|jgi:putative aminopeptidase FrvX|nr:MAG: putative aminopeptidase YhfE [Chloroflexota bacterium]
MSLAIDPSSLVAFLVDLLNTPSPTGYHREAMAFCRERFTALAGVEASFTRKGALMLRIPGEDAAPPPVGITAHADTLGLMVREIKSNGRLAIHRIGGLLLHGAESENVTIRTADDRCYRGTFALNNTSVHVNKEAATSERTDRTMEVRIDERVSSKADVEALGIQVGDFIFLDPRVEVTASGFIKSRFLDDKASVAAIYGALSALNHAGMKPKRTVLALISNYEEVGHGGAADWPAELDELLSIDMGVVGDGHNGDEFSVSLCTADGGGPYHFDMIQKLRELAAAHNIPLKPDYFPYYASDGTAYWGAGGGARVGLIGPGVYASHSYERTHTDAVVHTAHLIARYLLAE